MTHRSSDPARPSREGVEDRPPNRLARETSPYLLQHARNPVDWYPWGEEAFDAARAADKPVFLSVGYSTCHWCHVMERESFEDAETAAVLNEHFVPVKVDREERPDVDHIYMLVTQLTTGRGGWPNSVWLTPEGKPWYAGTYFPPDDRPNRPGFRALLEMLAEAWAQRRDEIETQARRIADAVEMSARTDRFGAGRRVSRMLIQNATAAMAEQFDDDHAGFGRAPKFPPHGQLRLLASEYRRCRDSKLLRMYTKTLDAMAAGGMHDHVGGGFHRYAVDREWFLPHFEKMLYDNAQLLRAYTDAHRLTHRERYRAVAEGIVGWVLREMTHPAGGFYSALDADSEGEEGKFYLWTREEIGEVLADDCPECFCKAFGVMAEGNFTDPVTQDKPGSNVLHLAEPLGEIARCWEVSASKLQRELSACLEKLRRRRDDRVRPHRDEKILTAWNALMISSLAHAGRHLGRPEWIHAAERALGFVLENLTDQATLLRTWREGEAKLHGYAEDYAFLCQALLELHSASSNFTYLALARQWADAMVERFAGDSGFYMTAHEQEKLLARPAEPFDNATPSGPATGVLVMARLAEITGRGEYVERTRAALSALEGAIERAPTATTTLLLAVDAYLRAVDHEAGRNGVPTGQDQPVQVSVDLSPAHLLPGRVADVQVRLHIEPGWRLYAPGEDTAFHVPTQLRSADESAASLGELRYDPAETVRVGGEDVAVYRNDVQISGQVALAKDYAGSGPVELILEYQPCDDWRCLEPRRQTLPLPVRRPSGDGGAKR